MNIPPEFLDTLAELAKRYGWEGDFAEVSRFIDYCFKQAGREAPRLEPYPLRTCPKCGEEFIDPHAGATGLAPAECPRCGAEFC